MDRQLPSKIESNPPCIRDDYAKWVEEFLRDHDVNDLSRQLYRRRLKQFFLWMCREEVQTPTRQDIIKYKRHLESKKFRAYTVSAYLVSVRNFFQWLHTRTGFPEITKGIKGPRRERGHRRNAFSIQQVTTILDSVDRSSQKGKRDYVILSLLAYNGLRTIELARGDLADLQQIKGEMVLFVASKGRTSKDQFVVIVEAVRLALADYLSTRTGAKPGDPLLVSVGDGNFGARMTTRSIRRVVREYLDGNDIRTPTLSAHSFRHFFISTAVELGVPIYEVQQAARHESLLSTQQYLHVGERAKGIAEHKVGDALKVIS
jgi:site-specific recombinase XerD